MAAKKAKRAGGTALRVDVRRRFAKAYIMTGNASLAYRSVFPATKGNPHTVKREGHDLLHEELTQGFIREFRAKAAELAITNIGEWLADNLRRTRRDLARVFDEDGNILPLNEIDPDTRAIINSIDVEEEDIEITIAGDTKTVRRSRVKKIKFDAVAPHLDMLGKYHGAYREDNKQRADPLKDLMDAINGRTLRPAG